MRTMITGALAAACGVLACHAAMAQYVPPFKGNDTGGIVSYSLASPEIIKALVTDHCAHYGKIVKITGMQPYEEGGYLSFACIWVPPGGLNRPRHMQD